MPGVRAQPAPPPRARGRSRFHDAGLTDSARGLLLYTVAQICRARVTGEPVLEETEDLIEATRAALAPALGHDLAGLRRAARRPGGVRAARARDRADASAAMLRADAAKPKTRDDDALDDDDRRARGVRA